MRQSRSRFLALVLMLMLTSFSFACAQTRQRSPSPAEEAIASPLPEVSETSLETERIARQVFDQVNQVRRDAGLPALQRDVLLDRLAAAHSREMSRSDRAPHHEGFEARSQQARRALVSSSFAENVASSSGHPQPAQVAVESWLESDGHRRNLLGAYHRTGLGVALSRSGRVYLTQLFTD